MNNDKIIQFKKHIKLENTGHSLSRGYVLFNEGKILYDKNKDDLALEKFIESEKLGFKSDEMFACMAWLYGREQGNSDLVIKYTDKAIKLDNENSYAYYLKGLTLEGMEKYKQALKNFLKAEEYDYSSPYLYIKISYCYEQEGDFLKSLAYASKAINKFPEEVDCYKRKAWAYFYTNNYSEALKYFLEAEKRGDTLNFFRISYCYSEEGNHKNALVYANKAIINDRQNYYGYYRKGFVYYMTEDYEKALKAFLETEKLAGENTKEVYDMYPRMSWIYHSVKNDLEKSIKYARKGLELNSKDYFTQYRMGCLLSYGYKKFKEALIYFKKAYSIDKNNVDIYYDISNTYRFLKKYKQGLRYVEEGLNIFQENYLLETAKISLLYSAQKYKESQKEVEKLLEKYPEDVWAKQAYGVSFWALKNYDKCIEYLEPVKNDLGDCNPFALRALSESYLKKEKYGQSLDTFLEYSRKEKQEYLEKCDLRHIKSLLKKFEKKFGNDKRIEEIKNNFKQILEV